ncbi:helix-turn-helix transcriptional regulator [Ruficoccus amylovorans]|uniref:Helix-turn-helix transcriptional regulator n=1 Tax=Ruficoccus amylovorans TaxID=1804625 RepID=A0A842HGB6_9BACT|nr:AraC family transcriptional regulator [Ruficoccus amylovorans]MBC2595220.1 helix-turn-helix transcriptional regulator [Ruficoccus amylovorans]
MSPLESFSRLHGGKFTRQTGLEPEQTRDYWLIMESFHPLFPGWIGRSLQIERNWGMMFHGQEEKRRTITTYGLTYVYEGEGEYSDDLNEQPIRVRAGDVICLFPGKRHAYRPLPEQTWNEIHIGFSGLLFDAWMGTGLLDPDHPVRGLASESRDVGYWLKRFHEVVLPLAKVGAEPALSDSGRLVALIAEMCTAWGSPKLSENVEWADKARAALISLSPEEPLDLVVLGQRFGLGEQAFRKKFKRLCGVTPTVFRSRNLVEQACHMLITSNASIKEIAFECGFGSQPYFSRRFKQITGVSPEEYRARSEV